MKWQEALWELDSLVRQWWIGERCCNDKETAEANAEVDAMVKAVEDRIAALETALHELVEDIDDTKRNAGELTVAVAFHRTNCPECDDDPEESIGLCPRHKAEALLEGTEDGDE